MLRPRLWRWEVQPRTVPVTRAPLIEPIASRCGPRTSAVDRAGVTSVAIAIEWTHPIKETQTSRHAIGVGGCIAMQQMPCQLSSS